MNSNKYSSLVKEIFKQINLPHNAVVADLGCRDAGFLLKLQQAFAQGSIGDLRSTMVTCISGWKEWLQCMQLPKIRN